MKESRLAKILLHANPKRGINVDLSSLIPMFTCCMTFSSFACANTAHSTAVLVYN